MIAVDTVRHAAVAVSGIVGEHVRLVEHSQTKAFEELLVLSFIHACNAFLRSTGGVELESRGSLDFGMKALLRT